MISKTQWREEEARSFLRDLSLTYPPTSFLLVLQGLAFRDHAGLYLMVTHDQAESSSLSSHALGSAGSMFHGITVPTAQLCFLSPLGRMRADCLLMFSVANRINLFFNKELPTSVL